MKEPINVKRYTRIRGGKFQIINEHKRLLERIKKQYDLGKKSFESFFEGLMMAISPNKGLDYKNLVSIEKNVLGIHKLKKAVPEYKNFLNFITEVENAIKEKFNTDMNIAPLAGFWMHVTKESKSPVTEPSIWGSLPIEVNKENFSKFIDTARELKNKFGQQGVVVYLNEKDIPNIGGEGGSFTFKTSNNEAFVSKDTIYGINLGEMGFSETEIRNMYKELIDVFFNTAEGTSEKPYRYVGNSLFLTKNILIFSKPAYVENENYERLDDYSFEQSLLYNNLMNFFKEKQKILKKSYKEFSVGKIKDVYSAYIR